MRSHWLEIIQSSTDLPQGAITVDAEKVAALSIVDVWSAASPGITLVRGTPTTLAGNATFGVSEKGPALITDPTADSMSMGLIGDLFPVVNEATIAIYHISTSTTPGVSTASFGADLGSGSRLLMHAPFTDGVAYFDFGNGSGGTTGGRVSVAFTKTLSPRVIVLIASPSRGREIWADDAKLASSIGTASIPESLKALNFNLGKPSGATTTSTSDGDSKLLFVIASRAWTAAEITEFTVNPAHLLLPQARYWIPRPMVAFAAAARRRLVALLMGQ